MNIDITTKEGRLAAYDVINKECKATLNNRLSINRKTVIIVESTYIKCGLSPSELIYKQVGWKIHPSSEVFLYGFLDDTYAINYKQEKRFTADDLNAVFKTTFAAECLNNWSAVCKIVDYFCHEHKKLTNRILYKSNL